MTKAILTITLSLTIFLSSCCSCRKGSPVIGNLENTEWKLTEINEKEPKSIVILIFDPVTKVINGHCDNCKIYGGYHLFEKETGNIEFMNPGFKGDSCEDIAELSSILSSITTIKIDSGHLLLIDKEGNIKAIFKEP